MDSSKLFLGVIILVGAFTSYAVGYETTCSRGPSSYGCCVENAVIVYMHYNVCGRVTFYPEDKQYYVYATANDEPIFNNVKLDSTMEHNYISVIYSGYANVSVEFSEVKQTDKELHLCVDMNAIQKDDPADILFKGHWCETLKP